jgi:hypothetical protein
MILEVAEPVHPENQSLGLDSQLFHFDLCALSGIVVCTEEILRAKT